MIPLDDRGLLLGDGLFETVLARSGELVLFEAHMARLADGCAALGLPSPSADEARALAMAALEEAGLGGARAAVRLTLTAGSGGRGLDRPDTAAPRLFATAAASPRWSEPATLAVASMRRNERSPASRLKTLAYLDNVLARREARAAGAEETILLNTRGELACAGAANLFWVQDGVLFTPALSCGVLAGTMRAALLARAGALGLQGREVTTGPQALDAAEAVFLTNSLVGARPVSRIGDRALAPHWLWRTLADSLAEVS